MATGNLGRRQVHLRAVVRPERQGHHQVGAEHHRADRDAGPVHGHYRHQETGPPHGVARGLLCGQIMPKAYFQKVGDDEFNAKPVGHRSGETPSWVEDDRMVPDAVKDYWGGKIEVDQIIFRRSPTGARIAALLKGEVDIITKIPPTRSTGWPRMRPPRSREYSTEVPTAFGGIAEAAPGQQAVPAGHEPGHRSRADPEGGARAGRRAEQHGDQGGQPL